MGFFFLQPSCTTQPYFYVLLIKKASVPAIDCVTVIDLAVECGIFPVDAVIRIDLAVELIKESIKYRE